MALVLPAAVLLSQFPAGTLHTTAGTSTAASPDDGSSADLMVPLAPLSLDAEQDQGDAPLSDDADIPVPLSLISLSDALAPVVVSAAVTGDRVNMRNGPGTDYDVVSRIDATQPLQVIGRFNDWFQVRERPDTPVYWISGELLDINPAAASTLFEVQPSEIPPPPPPKVATVRETGLQLRDGPGTNYVSITKLDADTRLDLLEIYQDWFHVAMADGSDGWVRSDFLQIGEGIVPRVTVAETIPDPSPDLVGRISDDKVNLRKGPDSRYAKVTTVNSGERVDLIGKYKDWVRVRLADGTKAWVFSDLLNASAHVMRRVPTTSDFPALPAPAKKAASSSGRSGNSADLARIPASGDVASFAVQFVGYRYRWGGASPGRGFDCSGLTSYVYAQHGISLPRTAAAQYSTSVGARVGSIDSLAPGDLVFFANTGGRRGISHVALYIGNGRIIHAMTPRYGVQVSGIYERYWTSHFVGGIRPRR